jgi:hypothetical protein
MPYIVNFFLQGKLVKCRERQREKQTDSPIEGGEGVTKCAVNFFWPATTAAGSGTPQWAVIGCPGQTGHISWAALSQTVKTKWSWGASGFTNSSHDLLENPSVLSPAAAICLSASGRTMPAGWLPALYAVKLALPLQFMMASAMMDRAELPVHKNNTL